MHKTFMHLALCFICMASSAQPSSSTIAILDRNTWSFSPQETKALNRLEVDVLDRKLISILKDATGYITDGRLMEFYATDLNSDGIAEVLARIDYSGRGFVRDMTILSRARARG